MSALNNFYSYGLEHSNLQPASEAPKVSDNDSVKEVSQQFESLFVDMMLQSMRKATQKSGLLDSHAMQTYEQLFDQELAKSLSETSVFGIAEAIERQIQYTQGVRGRKDLEPTQTKPIGNRVQEEKITNAYQQFN